MLKLEDFEVGDRLGESSSCAAVYAAKNKDREVRILPSLQWYFVILHHFVHLMMSQDL